MECCSIGAAPGARRDLAYRRRNQRAFLGASALLYSASVIVVGGWFASMPAGMPMPGGWTMSMVWMRMPGQTWAWATASFLGMWMVMTIAMMLPSLVPTLSRYREAVGDIPELRLGFLTAIVGVGYFCAWMLPGIAIFPIGVELAAIEMRTPAAARLVPTVAGIVVVLAGALQFTDWKTRHLSRCRGILPRGCAVPADPVSAWRGGLRIGAECIQACSGLTGILLVFGMMDLRAMTVMTGAITAERLAPGSDRVARAIGVGAAITGLLVLGGVV